jgi:hypothetical protein
VFNGFIYNYTIKMYETARRILWTEMIDNMNNRGYEADAAEQRTIGLRQNHTHTGTQANAQAHATNENDPSDEMRALTPSRLMTTALEPIEPTALEPIEPTTLEPSLGRMMSAAKPKPAAPVKPTAAAPKPAAAPEPEPSPLRQCA